MTATHIFDDIDAVHTVIHAHRQAAASFDSDSKLDVHNNKPGSRCGLEKQNHSVSVEEEDFYSSDALSSSDQSTLSNTSRNSTAGSDDISLTFEDRDGFISAEEQTAISDASAELQSQVKILRITYLLVTLVIMLADGLQGEINR